MNRAPIGLFDSGVGGLSILRELERRLPNEDYIFLADQKNVPYGEKTKDALVALALRVMRFLADRKIKLAVVACNTATCYAIEEMRAAFDIPIVGVVPAIKLAADETETGNIGLIATPATAQSQYVTDLIERYAANRNVLRIGCFGLENMVETGRLEDAETAELLARYILPLKGKNIDRLVLGCTHYPFLRPQIAHMLGPTTTLVDSSDAVARRVESMLRESGLLNDAGGRAEFFTTKDPAAFSEVASKLLERPVEGAFAVI